MLGVGVEAVRQSIIVDVAAHIDAAAHSTHVHVDCVLLDLYLGMLIICNYAHLVTKSFASKPFLPLLCGKGKSMG